MLQLSSIFPSSARLSCHIFCPSSLSISLSHLPRLITKLAQKEKETKNWIATFRVFSFFFYCIYIEFCVHAITIIRFGPALPSSSCCPLLFAASPQITLAGRPASESNIQNAQLDGTSSSFFSLSLLSFLSMRCHSRVTRTDTQRGGLSDLAGFLMGAAAARPTPRAREPFIYSSSPQRRHSFSRLLSKGIPAAGESIMNESRSNPFRSSCACCNRLALLLPAGSIRRARARSHPAGKVGVRIDTTATRAPPENR